MIEKGSKFFWAPAIFPYYITEANEERITYKRDGYAAKTVYRYVFEDAIRRGAIEFIAK